MNRFERNFKILYWTAWTIIIVVVIFMIAGICMLVVNPQFIGHTIGQFFKSIFDGFNS